MRLLPIAALLALAIAAAGCSETPPAGPVTITATSDGPNPHFDPTTVTVQKGDTVRFHVTTGHHTVDFNRTAGLSNGHSGDLGPLTSEFAVVFSQSGTFPFSCAYHVGMKGTVIVE